MTDRARRRFGRRAAASVAAVFGLWLVPAAAAAEVGARVEILGVASGSPAVALLGLEPAQLERMRSAADAGWSEWFSLHVDDAGNPPVAARYAIVAGRVELRPRYPLEAGLGYVAVFRPGAFAARLDPGSANGKGSAMSERGAVERRFEVPRAPVERTTVVEAIHPSRGVVPENLLKFYVHFSAPMTRGRAYRHLRIVDARGEEVELAFLELEYELWDPSTRRLTVLFDPGRLKAGLKPRRDVGTPLHDGFDFALEVDADWPDAEGNPLREGLVHRFRVTAPDFEQPDPEAWTWSLPRAGTREPFVVGFGEPLDAALLQHALRVVAAGSGEPVKGAVQLAEGESAWRFTPESAWRGEEYELRVDVLLEDLAGNSLARPFEVDLATSPGSGRALERGPELWTRSFVPRP